MQITKLDLRLKFATREEFVNDRGCSLSETIPWGTELVAARNCLLFGKAISFRVN